MSRNTNITLILLGGVAFAAVVALGMVAIRMTAIMYSVPGAPEGLATTPQLEAWRHATFALILLVAGAFAAFVALVAVDHRRRPARRGAKGQRARE